MKLGKCFYDRKAETHAALVLRIRFPLFEDFCERLLGNTRSVVADPALNNSVYGVFPCPDDNLTARSVSDGIGNQILKHTPQQTGVCIYDQIVGNLVD